ncbi:hypothetical protein K474DRAFT_1623717 [Panus rudis PR-1116 ss-1]|nr:hypothetical protein K474DRAFT_1623717 [Panus rudis PR-1116 ss-1]
MTDGAKDIVIREVVKDVWTFSRPFNLFGRLPVGGRSTAIRLKDGKVWVLASTPLTEDTKKKLAELGEVRWIIAPNAFHHLFVKPFKDAYPDAKVIGPEEVNVKRQAEGWQLDAVTSTDSSSVKFGFEEEIDYCFFSGHSNKDTVYLHKTSKTVIAADILFNLPGTEQYTLAKSMPYVPFFNSWTPRSWIMKFFVWKKELNYETMKRDVQTVASWDFEKWIPCHGNVIESNAKAAFKTAYARYRA